MQKTGYRDFPLKIFFFTVPKHFVEKPFCVLENSWYRKMLRMRERERERERESGGHHDFPSIIFLSHSTETSRRGTSLCFRKFLVSKNFMDKRGEGGSITIFRRKVVSNYRKTSWGNPSVFQKNSGIEKFYA